MQVVQKIILCMNHAVGEGRKEGRGGSLLGLIEKKSDFIKF